MLPELDRLVRLQRLDDAMTAARQAIDAFPGKSDALNARIESHTSALATVEQRLADNKTARQELEKDVAQVQTRLTRFKEQLMEVKTNKEYHAVQAEIATADTEVQRLEDQILERMLESDELNAEMIAAKQAVESERLAVSTERETLEKERADLQAQLEQHSFDRTMLVAEISVPTMSLFDTLSRGRKGIALGEARDGRCSVCQVRLRPQLYNELRRNTALLQCESCQRILYYASESSVVTDSP